MFDVGWGEFLLIAVVALIVIGPKELPAVLRAVGQWTGKIRRMASEFQNQFQEAMREAEMADLQKQVTDVSSDLSSQFDPLDFAGGKSSEPAATPANGAVAVAPVDVSSASPVVATDPTSPSADVTPPPPVPTPRAVEQNVGTPPQPSQTTPVGGGGA